MKTFPVRLFMVLSMMLLTHHHSAYALTDSNESLRGAQVDGKKERSLLSPPPQCFKDGTPCFKGEVGIDTCFACCSKKFHEANGERVCGEKKCLPDNTRCNSQQECASCCNPTGQDFFGWHHYARICGTEKTCLKDGVVCHNSSTCKRCCSGRRNAMRWITRSGKPLTCGEEPCLPDGTQCYGKDCKKCCREPASLSGFPEELGRCNMPAIVH